MGDNDTDGVTNEGAGRCHRHTDPHQRRRVTPLQRCVANERLTASIGEDDEMDVTLELVAVALAELPAAEPSSAQAAERVLGELVALGRRDRR